MRVALHQFAPEFPGRDRNWERIASAADSIDADVIVFPELTSCGYMYKSRAEIQPYTDSRAVLRSLEPIARRHRRLVVGGFAERAGGHLFNSAYVVGPKWTQVFRKVHLWNYEKVIFATGTRALTFDFQGHRLGVEVCYDLQFPELGSYYARKGVELLLVPMAWAEETFPTNSGLQQFNHLAISAAFAHGIYVGVCNRVGKERGALFVGESSLTDPHGRIQHLGSKEGTLLSEIDFSLLERAKRPNPRNDLDTDARLGITLPRTSLPARTSRPRGA
ncbi:MAG: carbon-nitrogen hydrolase family protein [Thermoplasmata archaeon]|nr:carbon-nitrogen hydrolase family protein [Thermoplasmata archaeon]